MAQPCFHEQKTLAFFTLYLAFPNRGCSTNHGLMKGRKLSQRIHDLQAGLLGLYQASDLTQKASNYSILEAYDLKNHQNLTDIVIILRKPTGELGKVDFLSQRVRIPKTFLDLNNRPCIVLETRNLRYLVLRPMWCTNVKFQ